VVPADKRAGYIPDYSVGRTGFPLLVVEAKRPKFRQACATGLEGIVSKRLTAPYRSGPSRDWIKVKNPDSPAMVRHRERRW
jgi:ATP-dependent DNA ligase